jgi:hypothetical protein
LISGVETKFKTTFEIVWFVELVNVPFITTTWLLLSGSAAPDRAEILRPVMFTESPSAACEVAIGNALMAKLIANAATEEVK